MDPKLLQLEDGQLHPLVHCLQTGCDDLRQREGLHVLTRSISEQYGRPSNHGRPTTSFRSQVSRQFQDIFVRQKSGYLRTNWVAAKVVAVRQGMDFYACV